MPTINENQRSKSYKHQVVSELTKIIGLNLKRLRSSHSMSQKDISKILQVSYQQVQKYESGKNRLSAEDILLLKQYFDVPFEIFYTGSAYSKEINNDDIIRKINSAKDSSTRKDIYLIMDVLCSN